MQNHAPDAALLFLQKERDFRVFFPGYRAASSTRLFM